MVTSFVHAMVAAKNEEGRLEMDLGLNGFVNLPDNAVHLALFRDHVGAIFIRETRILLRIFDAHLEGPDLCPMWSKPR